MINLIPQIFHRLAERKADILNYEIALIAKTFFKPGIEPRVPSSIMLGLQPPRSFQTKVPQPACHVHTLLRDGRRAPARP